MLLCCFDLVFSSGSLLLYASLFEIRQPSVKMLAGTLSRGIPSKKALGDLYGQCSSGQSGGPTDIPDVFNYPCPARRISSHSSLRPLRQCQPGPQHCIGPPAPRRTRPNSVEPGERPRRKWSRRRLECLPLLRWADDHRRGLRTRLPAPLLARPLDRAR